MPFNKGRAQEAVRFFERILTHTKGKWARQPFTLPYWQRKIVEDVYGTVRSDGLRQYRTVYVRIPKKNGKTELAAGFALAGLFLDQEAGAEIYSAASTRDQANLCHRVAARMVRQAPPLKDRTRIIDSTKVIYLKDDTDCFYKAISADADIQDGINPHVAIFDELHRQRNRNLFDVLKFGMATREQPLLFMLTTAGIVGESPLFEEIDDYALQVAKGTFQDPTFYPILYGLEDGEDFTVEGEPAKYTKRGICIAPATGWYKANPALGDFLRLDAVREEVEQAVRSPSKQSSLRRFRFNQRVNAQSIWISSDKWKLCDAPFNPAELAGRTCYGGLDLSTTTDITAFVKTFPVGDEILLLCDFWLPEEEIQQRAQRDFVPYDLWAAQGLIRLTPGNVVDYGFIEQAIIEQGKVYDIAQIGHDPWNATATALRLADEGFTMVPIRQGMGSLSAPTKEFEALVLSRRLRHGGNPVLSWMVSSTSVKEDAAGNKRPVKPERNKSSKRIDGVVAAIMAIDRWSRNEVRDSVYEERGLSAV